jgi:hypothetical protein
MPEILNLLAPLLLGSINKENLPKRVKKKKRSNFDFCWSIKKFGE